MREDTTSPPRPRTRRLVLLGLVLAGGTLIAAWPSSVAVRERASARRALARRPSQPERASGPWATPPSPVRAAPPAQAPPSRPAGVASRALALPTPTDGDVRRLRTWIESVATLRRESDVVVPAEVDAILEPLAASLDATGDELATADEGQAVSIGRRAPSLPTLLVADAVRRERAADDAGRERRLAALLRVIGDHGSFDRSHAAALRCAVPDDAGPWLDVLDRQAGHRNVLGWMSDSQQALLDGRLRMPNEGSPTLQVLRDDLPAPLQRLADALWFEPRARSRDARRAITTAATQADVLAAGSCLVRVVRPDGTEVWGPPSASAIVERDFDTELWARRIADWTLVEADLLVTRDVLRLGSRPDLPKRASDCPEWSIESVPLDGGRTLVRAAGAIRELETLSGPVPEFELDARGR